MQLLSSDQKDKIVEVILVLSERRRVACQLEAKKTLTMSGTTRILRFLYETMQVMVGKMQNETSKFHAQPSS